MNENESVVENQEEISQVQENNATIITTYHPLFNFAGKIMFCILLKIHGLFTENRL